MESPSKEKTNDDGQLATQEEMEEDVQLPYRFDIPNPRYYESPKKESPEEIESGYLPDVETEIETPRTDTPGQVGSGATLDRFEHMPHERRDDLGRGEDKISESDQKQDTENVATNEKMVDHGKNDRKGSSEFRPLSLSDSNSTTELLAEIERSLRRSPVPITPRHDSEPWMRVISEDKFHVNQSPSQGASGSSKTVRKELFSRDNTNGYEAWGGESQRPSQHRMISGHDSNVGKTPKEGLSDLSPRGTNLGRRADDTEGKTRIQQRSSHVVKEKLHHSGFSQKELVGEVISPHTPQQSHSQDFRIQKRSTSDRSGV